MSVGTAGWRSRETVDDWRSLTIIRRAMVVIKRC